MAWLVVLSVIGGGILLVSVCLLVGNLAATHWAPRTEAVAAAVGAHRQPAEQRAGGAQRLRALERARRGDDARRLRRADRPARLHGPPPGRPPYPSRRRGTEAMSRRHGPSRSDNPWRPSRLRMRVRALTGGDGARRLRRVCRSPTAADGESAWAAICSAFGAKQLAASGGAPAPLCLDGALDPWHGRRPRKRRPPSAGR